jgi:hypothetical protein
VSLAVDWRGRKKAQGKNTPYLACPPVKPEREEERDKVRRKGESRERRQKRIAKEGMKTIR